MIYIDTVRYKSPNKKTKGVFAKNKAAIYDTVTLWDIKVSITRKKLQLQKLQFLEIVTQFQEKV